MPADTIDLDDFNTWPETTRQWANKYADRLRDSTVFASDLALSPELEDEFRQTFGQRKVLAYHCTRLLPHEAEAIRTIGLRLLDAQLVGDRIASAVAARALSDEQRLIAETRNVYAIRNERGRGNQVCFVLGRSAFDDDPGGCDPLLRYWGGEAIRGGPDDVPEFATIGRPSIVVARLNLTRSHDDPYSWPALPKLFVGSLLGLASCHADVHYRESISGEDIVAIWQPGDEEYDRHQDLPR